MTEKEIKSVLEKGGTVSLVRHRPSDRIEHRFDFEFIQSTTEQMYSFIEVYDGDLVHEDFYCIETIGIIIEWLLSLKFKIEIGIENETI